MSAVSAAASWFFCGSFVVCHGFLASLWGSVVVFLWFFCGLSWFSGARRGSFVVLLWFVVVFLVPVVGRLAMV